MPDNQDARTMADTVRHAAKQEYLSACGECARADGPPLPPLSTLLDRFVQARANARRHGSGMAMLCVSLDDFGRLGETPGADAGARILVQVASRLAASVREADVVQSLGNGDFFVLLAEVSRPEDARRVADKLADALAACGGVGDSLLSLGASIGLASYPADGGDASTLMRRAQDAMRRARPGRLAAPPYRDGAPSAPELLRSAPALDASEASVAAAGARLHPGCGAGCSQIREAAEANAQLILAVLQAQDWQCAEDQRHERLKNSIAVVAHELRNPMAPIRNAAAMLSKVGPEGLPRLQAIIERQVSQVSNLVGDLLDVSRFNSGKLRLAPQAIDLATIVADAIDNGRPALVRRSQCLHVDVPAGVLEMRGDPARLVQVLDNLLENASKYTPEGGDVRLAVLRAGADMLVTVSDNGIGITAEALPHVFEPFVQESHAVGFNGAGLGLGLSVVRELVESHGGSVTAQSGGRGLGSRFVVRLPTTGPPSTPGAASAAA